MMDIRQLQYFVAVAEERNFSRAAERLHISQPPLSMQVKALEDDIGVRLLDRSNRGVSLTAAGQVFLDEARAILRRLEQARLKARSAGDGEAGTLAIGFVSIADYGILPPALKRFRTRFPKVEVQLHELTTDAQIKEIRAGRLDLGIALGPIDLPDLRFEIVRREKLCFALPTGHHLLKSGTSLALKTLANQAFIIPPRDVAPGLYDLIISQCRAAGFAPRISQHARQMQTVIGLVASGMGIALVPESVKNLRRPGVQYRPLRGAAEGIEIGTLQSGKENSVLTDNFIGVLGGGES